MSRGSRKSCIELWSPCRAAGRPGPLFHERVDIIDFRQWHVTDMQTSALDGDVVLTDRCFMGSSVGSNQRVVREIDLDFVNKLIRDTFATINSWSNEWCGYIKWDYYCIILSECTISLNPLLSFTWWEWLFCFLQKNVGFPPPLKINVTVEELYFYT